MTQRGGDRVPMMAAGRSKFGDATKEAVGGATPQAKAGAAKDRAGEGNRSRPALRQFPTDIQLALHRALRGRPQNTAVNRSRVVAIRRSTISPPSTRIRTWLSFL